MRQSENADNYQCDDMKMLQVGLSDSCDDAAIVDYQYNNFYAFRHTFNGVLSV